MLFRKLTRRMNRCRSCCCNQSCCNCSRNCNTCCCWQMQTCCEKKICCTSQIVQPVCSSAPQIESCCEIRRYIDIPMQTWYGPGYTETDCCLQQTEILREIADTLKAPRQTCLSCMQSCNSCARCR